MVQHSIVTISQSNISIIYNGSRAPKSPRAECRKSPSILESGFELVLTVGIIWII